MNFGWVYNGEKIIRDLREKIILPSKNKRITNEITTYWKILIDKKKFFEDLAFINWCHVWD